MSQIIGEHCAHTEIDLFYCLEKNVSPWGTSHKWEVWGVLLLTVYAIRGKRSSSFEKRVYVALNEGTVHTQYLGRYISLNSPTYALIYFWLRLLGLSGIVRLSKPSVNIGFIIFSLKYFSVLIPQKSCISFRVRGTIQKSSNPLDFMESSLTSVVTSVLTSVVMPSSSTEVGPTSNSRRFFERDNSTKNIALHELWFCAGNERR